MKKKLLSCACAGVMALSLAAPAFAAGTAISNGASVNFTGKPAEGEIAVVMQTGKKNLYVNPYGLPYTLGFGEVYTTAGATTFDKTKDIAIKEPDTAFEGFFSDTAVIQNNGTIALNVQVSMTTTNQGDAMFIEEADLPAANARIHQYMYGNLEIAPATISTGTAKVTKTAASGGTPAVMEEQTGVTIVTPTWTAKKTVAIPAGKDDGTDPDNTAAGTPSTVADTDIDLPAAQTVEDADTGLSSTVPGVVAYRLAGTTVPADAVPTGATAGTPVAVWKDVDFANVTVAFTFTPVAATPAP